MRQPQVGRRKTAPPRGVLHPAITEPALSRHVRYHPSPDLERYVEHYWSVEWNRRGLAPEPVEILPHPSVHLIFERPVGARIMGVARGKFSRLLKGDGGIFAVKFTPGGFYPFLRAPVSTITDSTAQLRDVFGADGVAVTRLVLAESTDVARIEVVEAFLRHREPVPDSDSVRMSKMVYAVAGDRGILKVDDLAARYGTNPRTLQRLFAKYVGVSPKWVIQRYRLHEAAEQLAGGAVKQAELALRLGYSDQAHFVRDFKAVVGTSPAAYARGASSPAEVGRSTSSERSPPPPDVPRRADPGPR
jgi:AraC-like DNA-binding protein